MRLLMFFYPRFDNKQTTVIQIILCENITSHMLVLYKTDLVKYVLS